MSQVTHPEFTALRAVFWPIHRHELKKLLPMMAMFFLVGFNYSVLRNLKDALVITTSGAEVVPFIKVWVMLPAALLMTYIFAKLSNRFTQERVFYLILAGFLLSYAFFVFLVYPFRDSLHPYAFADYLQGVLPTGFKGFISMFRNWTFTLFYVMSELWSTMVLSVLFWGFANQITRLGEAKRFYGLLGISANISVIAAGQVSIFLFGHPDWVSSFPFGKDLWEQTMGMLILFVFLAGLLTLSIFYWMHRSVLQDPRFYDPKEAVEENAAIGKWSLKEAFRYLLGSRYLIYIALVVICYNIVINFVEVLWKNEVRELYSEPLQYNHYMNQVSTWIGGIAAFSAFFISGNAIRKLGWTFTALLTPAIMLITSIGFFTFFFMKEAGGEIALSFANMSPLYLVVFFGSAQNILARSAKYTVFDATREMAFVPLKAECKMKGKAAIDGVCSRLGKSGGSLMYQGFLIVFSTVTASAPYIAAILFVAIGVWCVAVFFLGREFTALTASRRAEASQPSFKHA